MARTKATKSKTKKVEPISEPPEDVLAVYKQTQTKAKSWLWVGVLGISAIIFFFWGWSIVSRITLFNWSKSQESVLIKKSQQDWNQVFSPENNTLQGSLSVKEKLTDIISEIKKQAENSTSTTGTVITASTTPATTTDR